MVDFKVGQWVTHVLDGSLKGRIISIKTDYLNDQIRYEVCWWDDKNIFHLYETKNDLIPIVCEREDKRERYDRRVI